MLPYRIVWLDEARADVRRLERAVAMRIFESVLHYSRTGVGDVVALQGEFAGALRLRVGDYRVLFNLEEGTIRIRGVRNRREAYR